MDKDEAKKKRSKARESVYRLLKYRFRSEKEIADKLKIKGFDKATIDETIRYFKDLEIIDDRQFARGWISSRLNKPFGPKRIQHELDQKGIARHIIEEELHDAFDAYSEADVVLNLARKRTQKYKGIEPLKAKQRLFGYLSRRGFSTEAIYKAINQI